MSYFPHSLGQQELHAFFDTATGHVARALKAQTDPVHAATLQNYIHDAQLYNAFQHMDPVTVSRIMQVATAKFLASKGFPGARSNKGASLTPIYTCALAQVKDKFGADAVYSDFKIGFRGVRNTMAMKKFYIDTMDEIVQLVLAEIAVRSGDCFTPA